MKTSFGEHVTGAAVRQEVGAFYDIGSPFYFRVYGSHIHDGYYLTGKESKEEAQENLIKLFVEKAGIQRGARVLDVGCGVGGSSIWLAEHLGALTTGITISPVQARIAAAQARARDLPCSFLSMDAENMSFNTRFDVVWAVAMMTHLRDQEHFAKSACSLLNSGGKFIAFDWMLGEGVTDALTDPDIKPVTDGMLLPTMHPLSAYVGWLTEAGCRVLHAEDITDRTIKTWDDAFAVVRRPSVWRLAVHTTAHERAEMLKFIRSMRPMKHAMQIGKIRAGAVVAEKK